jgi:AcrR family transcriptional regulator
VSLSGLYYYFNSKEELLFLIQDHAFGTLLNNLERLLATETEPQRRLRILVENHLRYFTANTAEMKVLSHEGDSLTGDFRRRVNAKKKRLTEIAMEILGELRPDGDVDLRVATFALFGMMNWLYNWHRPETDVAIDRLVDDMYRIFAEGFLPAGEAVSDAARAAATGDAHPAMWRSEQP